MLSATDRCVEMRGRVEKVLHDAGDKNCSIYLGVAQQTFLTSGYVVIVRSTLTDLKDALQHLSRVREMLYGDQTCADLFIQTVAHIPELWVSSLFWIAGGVR